MKIITSPSGKGVRELSGDFNRKHHFRGNADVVIYTRFLQAKPLRADPPEDCTAEKNGYVCTQRSDEKIPLSFCPELLA
jgi:hypothetical protein